MRVSHLALYLRPGHKCGDGVDYDEVQSPRAYEGVGDLERLLAVIRLREVEVLKVDADGLSVGRVEGVLSVYERGEAALLLRLSDDMQGKGRLTARLGTENLDDTALGHTTDSQGQVEC